jgi:hypothetical protein
VKSRPPQDGSGRPTTAHEIQLAANIVDRSGVVGTLRPFVDAPVGRPRSLTLRDFLIACQINALRRHHQAHLVEVARLVNAFTDEQRAALGFLRHDPDQTYDRIERLYVRLCAVLDGGHAIEINGDIQPLDAEWFANCVARGAIPPSMLKSSALAVDGTDVETWGALQGSIDTIDIDVDADGDEVDEVIDVEPRGRKQKGKRSAKVLGIGSDGRNIYTADADARAGHRSATNSRLAGEYIGYELHLAVQTREVRWTNSVDKVTLSGEVPGVVTALALVPAGTHRGRAVADVLIDAKRSYMALDDVVVDPGYSQLSAVSFHDKLAAAGIHVTFRLKKTQRGLRPFSADAQLIDGQLYSSLLPPELQHPPMPPRGAPEHEMLEYEAAFNQRARWRMSRHAGPDADGATRWRCPFHAGFLKSRRFQSTMRRGGTVPLVSVPDGAESCCSGTFTAMPAELPLWQRIPFGTTAWRLSMGRRQPVESANAGLKGGFAKMSRGFHRVFGLTKITVLLAFTAAGYNLDRLRSFRAKHRIQDPHEPLEFPLEPRKRAKRRQGIWAPLVTNQRAQGPPV